MTMRSFHNHANHAYHAYLLSIWQEKTTETPVWRFSLEDPSSGQRIGFADLAALTAFLLQRTSET